MADALPSPPPSSRVTPSPTPSRTASATGAGAGRLDDPARLAILDASGLLELARPSTPALDRAVRLAARVLGAPVAQINLVSADCQTPAAVHGEPPHDPAAWATAVTLERSFCRHVVTGGKALVIPDARAHPLVCDSPAIRESGIAAYLGVPLHAPMHAPMHAPGYAFTPGGGTAAAVLGTLCVIDFAPRAWSARDVALLEELAAVASDEIALRLATREAARAAAEEAARRARADAVQATEHRYETILAAAGVAVLGVDAAGRTTFANPEAERILGWTAAELVGRDQHTLIHHSHADGRPYPAEECPLFAARHRGESCRRDTEVFWRKDGTPVPVAYVLTPIAAPSGASMGAPGEWHGAVLTFEDVSARRAADAELARALAEASEGRRTLHALLEHIPEGITIADAPDATVRHVSRYGRRLLGREADGLAGPPAPEHLAPWQLRRADADALAEPSELPLVRATTLGETVRDEEWVLRRPDGATITLLCSAGPIRDGDGRVTGGIVAWRDIDARKRRDRQIRLLQELTAALSAAATPDAVADVVLARGGAAVEATGGLLFLLRRGGEGGDPPADATPGAETATAWLELVAAHGYTEAESAALRRLPLDTARPVGAAVREGRAAWVTAPTGGEPDGAVPAPIGAMACLPLGMRDEVVGALCFDFAAAQAFDEPTRAHLLAVAGLCAQALDRARLFTAERAARAAAERAQAAAEDARRDAEGASQAKSHFLSTMSHELRTPLNAIGGYVQLMEMGLRGPVTAEQRDALARIDRAQRHLLSLIDDVLSYARIEARRVEYDVRPVSLAELVRDVTAMVEPQLAAKALTFVVDLADPSADAAGATPGRVWADREKLVQVLLNLLSNAVKFTPAGGGVTVTLAPVPGRADQVALAVRDDGIGIAAAQHAAVFEPFVQAHRDLSAASQHGTGLGLAISRELTRGMGGELTLASEVGRGSTFTVVLRRVSTAEDVTGGA